MKSQPNLRSRWWSVFFTLAFLAMLATGCGLVKKQKLELAGKSAAGDESQIAPAPVVLASALLEEESKGPVQEGDDARRDTTPPPRPDATPVGAFDRGRNQAALQPPEFSPLGAANATPETAAPAMRTVGHANSRNFQQVVLESEETVLVDFSANWCGYCKKAAPILEQFAKNSPNVKVVEVDFDKNRGLANSYDVRNLPTMMVFKGGQPVSRHSGKVSEAFLKKLVMQ